ncbi:MAG: hypothetical protein LBB23_02155 [Rickettsiales bacterium]|jgi:phosphoribosylformylglycinamidine cyclo-ligase|nr:hypothetical protein [Rickettsiales bacterium]
MSQAYSDLGVSAKKEDVHAATKDNDKGLYPYSFCKINQMRGQPGWVEFMHSDGAGTKASLAYIYWRETGDMSVWKGVVQDSIVMNLDDIACVGGLTGYIMLSANLDRNTFRIPGEVVHELVNGENSFLEMLRGYGIDIVGQCGETADVPDLTPTLVVNNSMHCRMQEKNVIDNGRIKEGDLIVGLASSGRADYETEFNGGSGSNGMTLMRHKVFSCKYSYKYPESYESKLKSNAYTGTRNLTDSIRCSDGSLTTLGKLVLSPTRTYAPVIKKMLDKGIGAAAISGIVHNSGGGQTKVLRYLSRPMRVVKDRMFETPEVFKIVQSEAKIGWESMFEDCNMGHRMEIYTPDRDVASEIVYISTKLGVDAEVIGEVKPAKNDRREVIINSRYGSFSYCR